jgi:hypothetical protein
MALDRRSSRDGETMKKTTQEQLAKQSKKAEPKQEAKKPEPKPAAKPEPKKAEPKKAAKRTDTSQAGRELVVKALEAAGFKGVEKSGWIRFQVRDGKISVASKGPQVHFRNLEVEHSGVERLSEDEAKKRHLGSVRTILWLDRQRRTW